MVDHAERALLLQFWNLSLWWLYLFEEMNLFGTWLRKHNRSCRGNLLVHCGQGPIGSSLPHQLVLIARLFVLRNHNSWMHSLNQVELAHIWGSWVTPILILLSYILKSCDLIFHCPFLLFDGFKQPLCVSSIIMPLFWLIPRHVYEALKVVRARPWLMVMLIKLILIVRVSQINIWGSPLTSRSSSSSR